MTSSDNRRRSIRLAAPLLCRVVDTQGSTAKPVVNISFGGVLLYANEPPALGSLRWLEISRADGGASMQVGARALRIDEMMHGSPAPYAVGFEFSSVSELTEEELRNLLTSPSQLRPLAPNQAVPSLSALAELVEGETDLELR